MGRATRIICAVHSILLLASLFYANIQSYHARTHEIRRICNATQVVSAVCLVFVIVAWFLLWKKHATEQKAISAFIIIVVSIIIFVLWGTIAVVLPRGDNILLSSRFSLLSKLDNENVQLYAISREQYPPALVLFRHGKPFILDWKCDRLASECYSQMMLNKDFGGNDELYITIVSEEDENHFEDLYVLQFRDTHGEEIIMKEYCLRGEDYRNRLDGYGISFDDFGLEYVELSDDIRYDFIDSSIILKLGVRKVSHGQYIGDITAKVHYEDKAFSLSDINYLATK
jgi:hypothetical protein